MVAATMSLSAIVLAIASQLGRGTPSPPVVDAIASGCEQEAARHPVDAGACVALVTTYVALESGYLTRPHAWSWDAKGGVSCSVLQLPCAISRDPASDVRTWLTNLRRSSLASVDSSPRRAAHRQRLAEKLLARVTSP